MDDDKLGEAFASIDAYAWLSLLQGGTSSYSIPVLDKQEVEVKAKEFMNPFYK